MREEKFLYHVSYAIDKMHGKMTVFYKDKALKTIIIHKNMSYNPQNEELAHQIALETELTKYLVKGEL